MDNRVRVLPRLVTAAKGMMAKAKAKWSQFRQPDKLPPGDGIGWFSLFYTKFMTIRDIADTVPGDISDRMHSPYARQQRAQAARRRLQNGSPYYKRRQTA